MKTTLLVLLIVSGTLAAAGLGYLVSTRSGGASEGRALYTANCASCHGFSLEGQPDWMKRPPMAGCRRRLTTTPVTPGITQTSSFHHRQAWSDCNLTRLRKRHAGIRRYI